MKSLCTIFLLLFASASSEVAPVKSDARIIGGQPARPNELPYQVSLQYYTGIHVCGGSIITLKHILSAAHCAYLDNSGQMVDASLIRVVAGTNDLNNCGEHPCAQVRHVSHIVVHESYGSAGAKYNFDAAILVLTRPLAQIVSTRPIALRSAATSAGENCTASGWGFTTPVGPVTPTALQKITIQIFNQTRCRELYQSELTSNMFCAGGEGGKDTCQGDSGGPLVCNGTLTGIVSAGPTPCAQPGYPGVYTEIAKISSWIQKYTTDFVCNSTQSRVIGGEEISIASVPYQVAIARNGTNRSSFLCSGTLLTLGHVLTTSACVNNVPVGSLWIIAGTGNLTENNNNTRTSQTMAVQKVESNVTSTLAILFLSNNFTRSAAVAPTNMNLTNIVAHCDRCFVSGWGNRLPGSPAAMRLLATTVSVSKDPKMCGTNPKGLICTFDRGPGPCAGDQGGPLVCNDEVVGLVSSNNSQCTDVERPSYYVDLRTHMDWIDRTLKGSSESRRPVLAILILALCLSVAKSYL